MVKKKIVDVNAAELFIPVHNKRPNLCHSCE
jgi:hypothetical protein